MIKRQINLKHSPTANEAVCKNQNKRAQQQYDGRRLEKPKSTLSNISPVKTKTRKVDKKISAKVQERIQKAFKVKPTVSKRGHPTTPHD